MVTAAAGARIAPPTLPALAVGSVHHTRHEPVRHAFTHAHYQWLVDVDDLPRLPWPMRALARFDVRDHLDAGRRGGGIRGDLARWLADRGITLEADDQVLMLAHARILGHVFDPLSVFWVLGPGGWLKTLVLEVHNTYGERHAYLADLDPNGRATLDKEFYVSPFNEVGGRYAVVVELTRDRVRVGIDLDQDDRCLLTAVTAARLVPATRGNLLAVAARHLLMTQRVSMLIRWHGVRLWLRRLPVTPRSAYFADAAR